MRGCVDAGVGGDRSSEIVERAFEGHELSLEELELDAVHADLVHRVVGGREQLDVRVEDAEGVDGRHELGDLLLQRRDEGPQLLHPARRAGLDADRDAFTHPYRNALERASSDRPEHRGRGALRPLGQRRRGRSGWRRERGLAEGGAELVDALRGEVGIGAAHAVLLISGSAPRRVLPPS